MKSVPAAGVGVARVRSPSSLFSPSFLKAGLAASSVVVPNSSRIYNVSPDSNGEAEVVRPVRSFQRMSPVLASRQVAIPLSATW